jgi:hypothetical protein
MLFSNVPISPDPAKVSSQSLSRLSMFRTASDLFYVCICLCLIRTTELWWLKKPLFLGLVEAEPGAAEAAASCGRPSQGESQETLNL